MQEFKVKLDESDDDRLQLIVTETVNTDGKPRIDVCMFPGHPGVQTLDLSRGEAMRLARALIRSVVTSRRKHVPRKGWP